MAIISVDEIDELSVDERLELLARIRASLDEADLPPLTESVRYLLDERLELYRANPERVRKWEDIEADLRRGD